MITGMGRTMPTECPHGKILDWGDFGDGPPEMCGDCLADTFNPILEILRQTRDQLAKDEADRVAVMGEFDRMVYERVKDEYQRRMDELMDEMLYGR